MKKHRISALLLAFLLLAQPIAAGAADSTTIPEAPIEETVGSSGLLGNVSQALSVSASACGLEADSALASEDQLELDGEALLLYEQNTGTMVYAKNIDAQREPASLTKVMTCLLALERGNLAEEITVTQEALSTMDPDGSSGGLVAGEAYTLEQLLYCLMVASANDAALVIAEHIGGSQEGFVELMNARAQELGCTGTHFANPHGFHADDHYTTARDLARIMEAALSSETFRAIYSTTSYALPATDYQEERTLTTTNYMLSETEVPGYYDSRVIGGKTGFTTPAGRCVMCVAEEDGMSYLAVVLGASATDEEGNTVYTSFTTASALFDYGFEELTLTELLPQWASVTTTPVTGGEKDATLILPEAMTAVLPYDYDSSLLSAAYTLPDQTLTAPVARDTEVGTLGIYYEGTCIRQSPMVVAAEVLAAAEVSAPAEASAQGSAPPDIGPDGGPAKVILTVVRIILVIVLVAGLGLGILILRAQLIRRKRRKLRRRRQAQLQKKNPPPRS